MRSTCCALSLCFLTSAIAVADDWPQWRGEKRDGVWREEGIVEQLPEKLDYKWRTPIGMGYAGPAVANGRVYVMDRHLGTGQANPDNPFSKSSVGGNERIVCLDEQTGEEVWDHAYECEYAISYSSGPRVTPTITGGKLYAVGAMGDFWCLDADTGKVLWSKDYKTDFGTEINTWGMAAHPLIDGDKVILLAAGDAGVVALNKDTGEEIWRSLSFTDPGYCPPVIIEAGGRRQLIIWTPVALTSLDPETGKEFWSLPRRLNAGLSISQPVFDPKRNLLLVTAFYEGSVMAKLAEEKPDASILWQGKSKSEIKTDGLHSIISTPMIDDGYIYGVGSYGQLRCLNEETGERIWETFDATGKGRWWNAFLIRHGDKTILANEQGDLIFAKLSPDGYHELSRSHLIEPTNKAQRRDVVWSHPAFANRCVFARNDKEIVCVDLSK